MGDSEAPYAAVTEAELHRAHARLVGANIRLARKAKGYTQASLGQVLGKERHHVSEWETGAHVPNHSNLARLALLLEHPVGWFHVEHDDNDDEAVA